MFDRYYTQWLFLFVGKWLHCQLVDWNSHVYGTGLKQFKVMLLGTSSRPLEAQPGPLEFLTSRSDKMCSFRTVVIVLEVLVWIWKTTIGLNCCRRVGEGLNVKTDNFDIQDSCCYEKGCVMNLWIKYQSRDWQVSLWGRWRQFRYNFVYSVSRSNSNIIVKIKQ